MLDSRRRGGDPNARPGSVAPSRSISHRTLQRIEDRLGGNFHLVRGSFGIMASTTLTSLAGFLFYVIAAHRWPAGQVGVATSLVAALSTIALIAGQPIATTILLRIPRAAHRRHLLHAGLLSAMAISSVEAVIAIVVLPSSVHEVRTVGLGALFCVGAIATSAGIVLDASSLAIRRPQLMVIRNASFGAGKLLLLAVIAIPAGLVSGPVAVVGTWAALSVASCAWERHKWLAAERVATEADPVIDERGARRAGWAALRAGFGLQVIGVLGGSLPPQLLPILVVGILGTVYAGCFSITWLVGGLCFMISPAVCQALLAEGSLHPDELAKKVRAAAVLSSAILAVPLFVYVFAGNLVLGLFGHTYAVHGTTLLVILAVSAIPDLITNVAIARYRVQNRLGAAAFVNGLIAVIAVGGAAWALPRYGINGAGWAWTVAEVAGCVALLAVAAASGRPSRAYGDTVGARS
jgi:O-antigen/teichoic acid export membrane protein